MYLRKQNKKIFKPSCIAHIYARKALICSCIYKRKNFFSNHVLKSTLFCDIIILQVGKGYIEFLMKVTST